MKGPVLVLEGGGDGLQEKGLGLSSREIDGEARVSVLGPRLVREEPRSA